MKRLGSVLAGLALICTGGLATAGPAAATAGSLSGPHITVTWDDANWYLPAGSCSRYVFQYTTGNANFLSKVALVNKFGDEDYTSVMSRNSSGSDSIQMCNPDDAGADLPFTLRLYASQSFTQGDGSTQIFEAPVVIHTRKAAAAPAPAAAPQKPAAKAKSVKCISKKTFAKKTFQNKSSCPSGWVKI